MTRSWMLMTAEGRHLGTYDGETREEAVRAMYEADPAFETLAFFLQRELDRLVELWGGRAVRVGSIPAMAAVSEGAKS